MRIVLKCRRAFAGRAISAVIALGLAARLAETQAPAQASSAATQASTLSDANERLLNVARLWVTVKYFHPYLAYKQDVDWDGALVRSLPKLIAAKASDEYAKAVADLLAPLHDPETGVPGLTWAPGSAASTGGRRRWIHSGLAAESGPSYPGFYSAFETSSQPGPVEHTELAMGQGVSAVVRLSEAVEANSAPFPKPKTENAYADQRYPSQELRLLAAFKTWGVFKYFFAYRDLLDEDWDQLLLRSIPRIRDAKDAREYNLAVSEFVAHVYDSQAIVQSAELAEFFGTAPPPLELRLIEKKPLVTRILDASVVKDEVKIGDVVLKVDGESMGDRIRREAPYISSSTQQWLGQRLMERILNGADGSTVTLTVRGPDAKEREVKLTRKLAYNAALRHPRTGEVMKILNGNIGYVDLDRLKDSDVEEMFNKFRETRAIIFDLRGRPDGDDWSGAVWQIAPRLTEKRELPAAIFNGPLTLTPDSTDSSVSARSASYFFVQTVPASDGWKYKGKTVVLVDERTIAAGEHAALLLEAASRPMFVGSPSAGADGDVTNFVIPGGIAISFSGHDVRHGNSGALQRTGLQFEGGAIPSIVGIRQGRDEVLDKAVGFLRQ
jgi:C-terminal processing protease CtpA/Prc